MTDKTIDKKWTRVLLVEKSDKTVRFTIDSVRDSLHQTPGLGMFLADVVCGYAEAQCPDVVPEVIEGNLN